MEDNNNEAIFTVLLISNDLWSFKKIYKLYLYQNYIFQIQDYKYL